MIDSRSPAADALLDYREQPTTPRSDRIVELERELDEARASLVTEKKWRKDADGQLAEACAALEELLSLSADREAFVRRFMLEGPRMWARVEQIARGKEKDNG